MGKTSRTKRINARCAAFLVVIILTAGCGGSYPKPHVCNVYPNPDGQTLRYSPPGCEHHPKGEILNIHS